ncbi:Adrenodoxin protein mitochondrial, partial [Trichostrongylus colubriformis]
NYNARLQDSSTHINPAQPHAVYVDYAPPQHSTLACCTCHVVLSPEHFERVDRINPAGEEELDLLDLAPELTDHSRLGCQVQVEADDPDTIVVKVPVQKRDARTLE